MTTIYTVNNKVLKNSATDKWLTKKGPDPYNPLGLPPFTIRCKFSSGYTPSMGDSQTLVDAGENVWDITKNSTDWQRLLDLGFMDRFKLEQILGANTTGVTNMMQMCNNCESLTYISLFDTSTVTNMYSIFSSCRSLQSVPLFDTSSCTTLYSMFNGCSSLTSVPLFDTSSCGNMNEMFSGCTNVKSGALALYQKASTQAIPPVNHWRTFLDCGRDTVTGAAELAQIPDDWKS